MTADEQDQDLIVLPPLVMDPLFAQLVDDAVCGPALRDESKDARPMAADPHDFAGLYIRHRTSFGLHARRFLRDTRDVEEVVQEAFLRLFLALPELETELQALAYCRRTITNLCIDRYRADQRRPRLLDLESVPLDQFPDDDYSDPVIRAEEAAQVRLALSLLSPAHRQALVMREIEEKPLSVIATELDIPQESVKHLLFRARRALRRLLAGTQLQPGTDPELTSTLELLARRAASGAGKVAGVAAILLIALSSGPNLHAIPLVGTDLPDLPSILQLVRPEPPAAVLPPAAPTRRGTESRVKAPRSPFVFPVTPLPPVIVRQAPAPSVRVLPLTQPSLAASPSASPSPSPNVTVVLTSASPEASISASPQASSSPTPKPSASASATASASPSPSASTGPTAASTTVTASPSPGTTAEKK